MKYYKTKSRGTLIVEVEVTKETDKFVYAISEYNGREERVMKISHYAKYFKTFEEAKEFLKTECEGKIKLAQSKLEILSEELEYINELHFVHENVNNN